MTKYQDNGKHTIKAKLTKQHHRIEMTMFKYEDKEKAKEAIKKNVKMVLHQRKSSSISIIN